MSSWKLEVRRSNPPSHTTLSQLDASAGVRLLNYARHIEEDAKGPRGSRERILEALASLRATVLAMSHEFIPYKSHLEVEEMMAQLEALRSAIIAWSRTAPGQSLKIGPF